MHFFYFDETTQFYIKMSQLMYLISNKLINPNFTPLN